ncbi:tail protein X [Foetidibacter luteolus]|uniref:tail protein X n=1 Tax=Foetidibacter luteolus TaxID=2608880 RepID=UPI00129BCA61|nr:tail protein X [Foetidibacter luteolus]
MIRQITTKGGERWDNIALSEYGNPAMMGDIIAANPGIDITDTLPAGVVLDIPIIQKADVATSSENVPPWKR